MFSVGVGDGGTKHQTVCGRAYGAWKLGVGAWWHPEEISGKKSKAHVSPSANLTTGIRASRPPITFCMLSTAFSIINA